jgi:phage terminase large subunit-like protein
MDDLSLAQRLALLPPEQRQELMDGIDPEEFLNDWSSWRRKSQTPPPGDWSTWLFMAGRGAGKTRTASEWIHERVRKGYAQRILLLGRTSADVRDVMIHGDSGLLNTGHPDDRPEYFPSKRLLVWPGGKAEALLLSADEPDQARGPQADTAWCIAKGEEVLTARGWIKIENVRENAESVLTRQGWKRVQALRSMGVKPVVRVTTSMNTIRCTPDHRLWSGGRGWVEATDLYAGEMLHRADGHSTAVVGVEFAGEVPTYDLTVEDAHEYYASGLLVHNCDEFSSFPGVAGSDGATAFDNLRLGLRLPVPDDMPRMILTTTPRRTPVMYKLLDQADDPQFGIVITRGTTYENLGNLADSFKATILGLYEGTRLGRQELLGEMLTDIEGALFQQAWFEESRVEELPSSRMYSVVGVDPSVAERPTDECGIVVVKASMERDFYRRHVYVVEDASVRGSPDIWAKRVAQMARKWDAPIVAEGNQGGELVRMAIAQADSNLPVHIVHATAGKATRAEPVAAALQQGRVHMYGWHTELEDQAINWVPSESRYSPDRLDAFVWGVLSVLTRQKGVSFTLGRHLRARSSRGKLPALNADLFGKGMSGPNKSSSSGRWAPAKR